MVQEECFNPCLSGGRLDLGKEGTALFSIHESCTGTSAVVEAELHLHGDRPAWRRSLWSIGLIKSTRISSLSTGCSSRVSRAKTKLKDQLNDQEDSEVNNVKDVGWRVESKTVGQAGVWGALVQYAGDRPG